MEDKLRGRMGEALAADYLRRKRYTLLACNYHSRFGEIDLIAKKRGVVAFVEVKLRADGAFLSAMEQVDAHKRERILRTAMCWIAAHNDGLQPRFDVCEIYLPRGEDPSKARVNYLENAFGEN